MFIPYKVDVPFDNRPVMNWLVFVGVILAFVLQVAAVMEEVTSEFTVVEKPVEGQPEEQAAEGKVGRFVLDGWKITGLFGHMWLHGGLFHLIGNLIFLWLFGNAVCSKIGSVFYLPVYVVLGLVAAVSHLIFIGGPMIGASGAINGIVGMYLVFFPENSISCFFVLFFHPVSFSISGYWMILLWFAFDIWGAVSGGQGVAYFAHIGGFAAGFGLAVLMLKAKWVEMERDEKSLLQMLSSDREPAETELRRDFAPWQQQWEGSEGEKTESETFAPEPEKPEEEFIRFACLCGKRVKVPIIYAGSMGRCPRCKRRVRIPEKNPSE
ncbi:MAG: rhomboid family intramembrane serine protease [Planctomycetota bacterium]|jgi:membrane associated rhomboid family serine protease